jgi:hypothetical protein
MIVKRIVANIAATDVARAQAFYVDTGLTWSWTIARDG